MKLTAERLPMEPGGLHLGKYWFQFRQGRRIFGPKIAADSAELAIEMVDAAGLFDARDMVAALKAMLTSELSRRAAMVDQLGVSQEIELDPETERQLRALGYLSD